MQSVKPLLIACVGRALTAAPLGRREDDVEVRRVPVLPRASALDPSRPTVVLLDRTLLASSGAEPRVLDELAAVAALVGWGDANEDAPRDDFPSELLTGFLAGGASPGAVITALRAHNVQVGRLFPAMPRHLRVTIGTPEDMRTFMAAFRDVITA